MADEPVRLLDTPIVVAVEGCTLRLSPSRPTIEQELAEARHLSINWWPEGALTLVGDDAPPEITTKLPPLEPLRGRLEAAMAYALREGPPTSYRAVILASIHIREELQYSPEACAWRAQRVARHLTTLPEPSLRRMVHCHVTALDGAGGPHAVVQTYSPAKAREFVIRHARRQMLVDFREVDPRRGN